MPLAGYPDGQPRSFANSFASNAQFTTSTVGGSTNPLTAGVAFGFQAALVKITVDVGTFFLRFDSTGLTAAGGGAGASASDYKLTSGDLTQDFYCFGVGISGMSLASASTVAQARIGAWG